VLDESKNRIFEDSIIVLASLEGILAKFQKINSISQGNS
jgi:hypothetical protein